MSLTYDLQDGVAVVTMDDGKVNALSHDMMAALEGAADRAEAEATALVLAGRPGKFCAGFDLSVMTGGTEQDVQELVARGARLSMRLFGFPLPVVAACTGHALAAGAILLMASDIRIGADGEFKLGLNEVSIGMPVPVFATELAAHRLSKRHFTQSILLARVYTPAEALDVGFLDELADDPIAAATERARQLGRSLSRGALARTRQNTRGATISHVLATIDAYLGDFAVES